MKIAFFGTPELCLSFLEKMKDSSYLPSLVITNPDKPIGRKQEITPTPVKIWAKKNNIEVLNPEKIKDEFLNYRDKTFNTDFYNYLKEEYENLYQKVISREEMKELIYKVFFSQNFAYKKEKFLFKEKFPTISQIIYKLKKQRHNKFALCLQRIESEIFIKKICKRLVENDIIPLTIHDSVIVIAKDEEKTLQIVSEVYSEVLHGIPEFECSVL